MAKLLFTVPLTAPAASGAHAVDATFTMAEHYTLSGSGGSPTVTLYWQFDQGSGTWIDIPTTGSTGLVASAASQARAAENTTYSRTITCKSVGVYVIRAKGVSSTPTTVYSTNTPTVTVDVIPTAPTSAHTDSKADTQIVMGWTDNSNNETGFKIYKDDVCIETIAANSVSYTFTGLTAGTQYDLAVKATNAIGDSAEAQLTETTTGTLPTNAPYLPLDSLDIDSNDDGVIDAVDWAAADAASGKNLGQAGYNRKFDILFADTVSSADVTWTKVDQGAGFKLRTIRNNILTETEETLTWSGNAPITLKVLTSDAATIQKFSGTGNPGDLPTTHGWAHGTGHPYVTGVYVCWNFAIDMAFAAYKALGYATLLYAENAVHAYNMFFIGGDWQDLHNWRILEPQTGDVMSAADNSAPYDTSRIFFPIKNNSVSGFMLNVDFAGKTVGYGDTSGSVGATIEETLVAGYLFDVALGAGGALPPVGIPVWTQRALPITGGWTSIAYGNGIFVALSSPSAIAISSPDGITWTQRTLPSTKSWRCVTFGNGIFVAIAYGSNAVAISSDGITWVAGGPLPANNAWHGGLAWDGLCFGAGLFVAVASHGGDNNAAISSDGITWTPKLFPYDSWNSVRYGNGTFIAISAEGTSEISTDGDAWESGGELPLIDYNYISLAFGNEIFVAISQVDEWCATTTDGVTWTPRLFPATYGASRYQIGYGNGYFVVSAYNVANVIISTDGIDWALEALPISGGWYPIGYGNGVLIVMDSGHDVAVTSGSIPGVSVAHSFPWVFKFCLTHKKA